KHRSDPGLPPVGMRADADHAALVHLSNAPAVRMAVRTGIELVEPRERVAYPQSPPGLPALAGDDDRVDEGPRIGAEPVRRRCPEARQPDTKAGRPPNGH